MKSHILGVGLLLTAVAAAAQMPISVQRFDEIELRGGGTVTLRQGAAQSVTMTRGDADMTRFTVEDGKLIIQTCVRSCRDYNLAVDVVVPRIEGVAITGGGQIRAEQGFGASDALAAAVQGGGSIDVRAIPAASVTAAVQGGGHIRTRARDTLTAAVTGGGSITYWGDPRMTEAVQGGGSIQRGTN